MTLRIRLFLSLLAAGPIRLWRPASTCPARPRPTRPRPTRQLHFPFAGIGGER
jgi:hypothetical protein